MGEGLRIDDLSRVCEVSVRNIREYQDRGLLPAPRRDGRVALYDDIHVVRLRLISRLLARGYTLAVIRELLDAWAQGRDLDDVLGLETAVSQPWGDDESGTVTRAELADVFRGWLTDGDVRRLVAAGVLVPGPDGFGYPRRRLLDVFPTLIDAGIPAGRATALIAGARPHLDAVAEAMVGLVVDALLPEGTPAGLPEGPELARLVECVEQLRPVADVVAGGLFGAAMRAAVDRTVDVVATRALAETDPGRADQAPSEV